MEQEILDHILEHWHKEFSGISALAIARELKLPHEAVLASFDRLEALGKGKLKRDVTLVQTTFDTETKKLRYEPIVTIIFFPSKEALKEDFSTRDLYKAELPEYEKRLHLGGSQIQHAYFSLEALRKFLDHLEMYEVDNTVVDGVIQYRISYLSSLSEADLEKLDYGLFRFGKRTLSDGNVVIAVILPDLAQLSAREQRYWHAYEVEAPTFNKSDPDFDNYYSQNFEAEFVENNDPLALALDELQGINSVLNKKLFNQETNVYLSYPVVNTYKSFCDSCNELYKLVGADSLVEATLKDLLTNYFGYSTTDFVHESGRNRGKKDLFKMLCRELGVSDLADVIDEIAEHRVSAAHRIMSPDVSPKNYIADFRVLVQRLNTNLQKLRNELEKRS